MSNAKTPQDAWRGEKERVGHLRIFGSIAYSHVLNQGRYKLDDNTCLLFMKKVQKAVRFTLNGRNIIVSHCRVWWRWLKLTERIWTNYFFQYLEEIDQEVVAPKNIFYSTSFLATFNLRSLIFRRVFKWKAKKNK